MRVIIRYDLFSGGPEAGLRDQVALDTLLKRLDELEKIVSGVVKATIESSLGRIGTVGALAVEEFIAKLRDAMPGATATASNSAVVDAIESGSVVVPPGTPVRGQLPSVEMSHSSPVPSAFGGGESSVSAIKPSAAAAVEMPAIVSSEKPGKNLKRSREGF